MRLYKGVVFPIFERLDPETGHRLAMRLLSLANRYPSVLGFVSGQLRYDDPRLNVDLWGYHFPSPVGLAGGLDKDGLAPNVWFALGFDYVEIGTVTPQPQIGRARPRIFRDSSGKALINRMGFPNAGMSQAWNNLARSRPFRGFLALNAGANALAVEQGRAVEDYLEVVNLFYSMVDGIVINVSSPNTTKLRDLQGRRALERLLEAIISLRKGYMMAKPILVKVAPDLTETEIREMAEVFLGLGIDGVIATNTTISRPDGLPRWFSDEQGGLSGSPLFGMSTGVLRLFFKALDGKIPLVGVGGVTNAAELMAKIRAGATLVQLYTGLVYQGPSFPRELKRGVSAILDRERLGNITDLIGSNVY